MKGSVFFIRAYMAALAMLLLVSTSTVAQTKWALTVFIGQYGDDTGWRKISAQNDRAIILDMLGRSGFSDANIICLEDSQATYDGIIQSLELLEGKVRKGDEVYVHFSCHGQQITDLDGDERVRKADDLYDEAVVPYDAPQNPGNGYMGERHLTDDVINEHMQVISSSIGPGGQLILVVDACHSGGMQRTWEDDEESYEQDGMLARGGGKFELPRTGARFSGPVTDPSWVTINACKDFQKNWECVIDGKRYGRLSYALSRVFRRGIQTGELISGLKDIYSELPVPGNMAQNIDAVVPESLSSRRWFK